LPSSSEILVVDDESNDCCTNFLPVPGVRLIRLAGQPSGVVHARNRGAAEAVGEIVVFADGHIDTPAGWWEPLVDALADRRIGAVSPAITVMGNTSAKGYGQTLRGHDLVTQFLPRRQPEPYPVPILPGCCLAMRCDTFREIGGYDPGLVRWGTSDVELSIRLWLLGYELWVVPAVEVAHLFRPRHPYKVEWRAVIHNKLRTALIHFREERFVSVTSALKDHKHFPLALADLALSPCEQRRTELLLRRSRDDDWFFARFAPTL
jgi:GT2 family glycosyltransferase